MRREICRRTSTARTHLWAELPSRERPRSVADRKAEMCSIFDVSYMTSVFAEECKVRSDTEKGTQLRLEFVVARIVGSYHTTPVTAARSGQ